MICLYRLQQCLPGSRPWGWRTVLRGIDAVLEGDEERAEKVVQIAELIRAGRMLSLGRAV
jgi:hypothetical protein